jgi:hypothetical protein
MIQKRLTNDLYVFYEHDEDRIYIDDQEPCTYMIKVIQLAMRIIWITIFLVLVVIALLIMMM